MSPDHLVSALLSMHCFLMVVFVEFHVSQNMQSCKVSLCSCENMPAHGWAGIPVLLLAGGRRGNVAVVQENRPGRGSGRREVTEIESQMEERCKVEEQSRDLRNRPEEEEAG